MAITQSSPPKLVAPLQYVASGRFIQQNNVTRVFRADAPAFSCNFSSTWRRPLLARANGMPSCLSANSSPILLISVPTAPPRSCPWRSPSRAMIHDLIAIDFGCLSWSTMMTRSPSPSSARCRVSPPSQHARLQRAHVGRAHFFSLMLTLLGSQPMAITVAQPRSTFGAIW